jgi:transcriptional regulator
VVHAGGSLKVVSDKKVLRDLQLINKFEKHGSTYDFAALPDSYTSRLIGEITGFEMEIERLDGKFKLGQNGSDAEKENLLLQLRTAKPERSAYEFTAAFYELAKKTHS